MKYFLLTSLSLLCFNTYAEKLSFNKDVLPILSDKCYFCHGPDAHDIKGKLQLHTFENATHERIYKTKSGRERQRDPAIIPGKPEESLVWERIKTDDEDEVMPPIETHKPLTEAEKQTIKMWIEQGAEYEPHWSYTPIKSQTSTIDDLVKAKLNEHKLDFNEEADKRTLVRRLSFDLRGLPPSPQEIKDFLNDSSPKAWEKLIDKFLASSSYGEKMALMWLDLVRYADTVGYHGDQIQHVEAYRDYVIQAFNDNKAFDQFTREQLAGDLLPNPSQEHIIASAYNRLNMMSREGGAQAKEYLAKYAQDRVATTSIAWMGSTIACAECHDHKYDPFTAKDFYSFAAFFADIQEVGVYNKNPVDGKRLDNSKPFPPLLHLNKADVEKRKQPSLDKLKQLKNQNSKMQKALVLDKEKTNFLQSQLIQLSQIKTDAKEQKLSIKLTQKTSQFVIEIPRRKKNQVQFESLSFSANGKALKIKSIQTTSAKKRNGEQNLLKNKKGWSPKSSKFEALVISFKMPLEGTIDAQINFTKMPSVELTLSSTSGTLNPFDVKNLRTGNKDSQSYLYLLLTSKDFKQRSLEIPKLEKKLKDLERQHSEYVQITVPVEPRTMRILPKGNWQDDSGEIVQPAIPSFLGKIEKEGRANRLDLANWLTSKENPLTSRALTNRLWKQFFGRGLAADVTDLGAQGQAPENPALLDYLSSELINRGWDIKQIVKLIVSSKAYRQSSEAADQLKKYDPFNDYLARQQSRRLDAEFIRDNILEIASLLKHQVGGPAAKPYQPEGYYKDLNFPRRVYQADGNDQQYRRGIYMHRQRTFTHPMLKAFDAPSREQCVAARPNSNTPLQALNLLNDPSFVEAAKIFAQNTLKHSTDTNERLAWMFEKCTGRQADKTELAQLTKVINSELDFYQDKEAQAKEILSTGLKPVDLKLNSKELAAWTSLARVLLNLHETITVY